LNGADHHAERGRNEHVVLSADRRDGADRSRDQDRVHGHRADREMSRRPEHGVEQERRNRRVKPVNRWKTCEERVAHRLWHQHHRGGQAGD
jgi:hypothetical protein